MKHNNGKSFQTGEKGYFRIKTRSKTAVVDYMFLQVTDNDTENTQVNLGRRDVVNLGQQWRLV